MFPAAAAIATARPSSPQPAPPPRKRRKLSDEQRRSIVVLQQAGQAPTAIGLQLGLQAGTVRQHLSRVRHGGAVERPKGHGGGKPLSEQQKAAITGAADADNSNTLLRMAAAAASETGKRPARHTVSRVLKEADYTHKRMSAEAKNKNSEKTIEARKIWVEQNAAKLTAENTIYFDESAMDSSAAPSYGWNKRGQPGQTIK